MSTPGAIGVYLSTGPAPSNVSERAWRGVYHHSGGQPDDLGQELLRCVGRSNGDLARVVRELIDAAPRGWSSIAQDEQLADQGLPVTPDDTNSVAYAYVFDLGGRRLDAFATHAEARGELGGSVFFSTEGTATPAEFAFVEPKPPAARARYLDGWEPSSPEDTLARAETRMRVERDCANAELPVPVFISLVAGMLTDALERAEWENRKAPLTRLFIRAEPRHGDFWTVRLGQLPVCYPPPIPRRNLVRTDIEGGEHLTVVSQDDASAELDVRRSTLARLVREHQTKVVNVLLSAFHPPQWLFGFLDYVRSTQVQGSEPAGFVPAAALSKPPWKVFRHADGRVWAIRPGGPGYLLRLGAPDDEPVLKERKSNDAEREISRLIAEQKADGFTAAPDEPS